MSPPRPLAVDALPDDLLTPVHRPPSLTTMTSGMLSAPLVLVNTFHHVQPPPSPVVPSLRPRHHHAFPSSGLAPPMARSPSSEQSRNGSLGLGAPPDDASDALGESAPLLSVCSRCALARQCAFEALDPHLMPSHLARHWMAYAAGAAGLLGVSVALGTSSSLRKSLRSSVRGVLESMRSFFREHIWQPTTMIW